ncbi:O-antigen ligase family protein [Natronococcus sp. A-GB1]|uniref:O-antigen ligase family protein n=1 Tax=Natronococcus sp. A-GB1 TaxID=3037648 RepID=UPI00241F033B|nr:O-antigen ligase family protein [Natronococcus sp. A-GB1]MDG5759854.1 O-antigen ligase family protein [Natronococcus sp. A-GB1]
MRLHDEDLDAAVAVCYVAFVFSGVYKSAWYLEWSPIDLTVLLGGITVGLSALLVVTGRLELTHPSVVIPTLFGLFAGYAVLSGLWTPSTEYYFFKSLRLVGVTGLALGAGAVVVATSSRRLRYAGFATAGVGFVTALEMLYRYQQAGGGELSPFGTNYLITGRAIGFGLLLAVGYLVLSREDRTLTIAALFGAVTMSYALLVSGARGPTVAVAGSIGLLVLAGIVLGTLPNGRIALAGYSAVGLVSLIGFATVARQLRGIQRLLTLADGPGRSLGLRFGYWTNTFDALNPTMLLFGEGFGAWPVLIDPGYDTRYYPHNIVLEVLFELGIVGLVLLGALFGYALLNAARDWLEHEETTHVVLGVLFAYMLVNAMVTGDLNDNRFLFAIVGVMAYTVGSRGLASIRSVSLP